MTHHIIADAKRLGAEIPCVREVRETLRHFERELDVVKTPCLVHFDLRPEHIFVRQEAGAPLFSAVIDPDCAYWGDPAGGIFFYLISNPLSGRDTKPPAMRSNGTGISSSAPY